MIKSSLPLSTDRDVISRALARTLGGLLTMTIVPMILVVGGAFDSPLSVSADYLVTLRVIVSVTLLLGILAIAIVLTRNQRIALGGFVVAATLSVVALLQLVARRGPMHFNNDENMAVQALAWLGVGAAVFYCLLIAWHRLLRMSHESRDKQHAHL